MDELADAEKASFKIEIHDDGADDAATEDRLCNGHAQPVGALSVPTQREEIRECSACAEPSDRLLAQFVALSKAVSSLDETRRHGALCLFEKVRPLISVSNAALGSGSEDQMVRLWSACILYCALKLSPDSNELPVCKLSHILDSARVSLWDFFKELPQFLQKTNSVLEAEYGNVREKLKQVKDLQAGFTHLAVLFNCYKRNYNIFFLSSRMTNCSCSQHSMNGASITCDHFRFGWMLFLALREHVLAQFDLVTCTNGLIAILAIMILHVPAHRRKFPSFKADLFGVRGPSGANIVGSLCQLHEASEEEVSKMLEKASDMISKILKVSYVVKPPNTCEQLGDIDTERVLYFDGLMGESSLCSHLEVLNKDYEETFRQRGELDERVFLDGGEAVHGMLADSTGSALGEVSTTPRPKRKYDMIMMSPPAAKAYSLKGNLMSPPGSPRPSPMKANSYKMPPPTPITSTMTSAKWLRTVIAPLSSEPSSNLLQYFQSCDSDITKQVKYRAQVLLEAIFLSEKKATWSVTGGMNGLDALDSSWAEQRRQEALKLYYRVLCAMCQAEAQRLHSENLSSLLVNERFHRCMLACSAELVLATYKTVSLNFPAVLGPTGITAFDIWKVIESFVRHEETLPRDLKRHLNSIEEKILEKLAWEKGSSLYNSLVISKPNLQEEIYRLNLLAEPMPSLEALHSRYQLLDGGFQGDKQGLLYSPFKFLSSTGSFSSTPACPEKAGCDFLSPVKDRQSAPSTITLKKTRIQPPLQSAFASPHRINDVGGETCAETVATIFLQKALKLAAIRIKVLCESLKQPNVMEDVYKTIQHILFNETGLLFKRHIDQILLCSLYGVCKVKQLNVTFKQIIQHYKQNPHDSYIYRTVFFNLPPTQPLQKGEQGTGDIIAFYNAIFVPAIKGFLMQSNISIVGTAHANGDTGKSDSKVPGSPGPSPFSSLPDMSPKKVSAKHNVYVSPLRSSKIEPLRAPSARSLYACVGESTHAYQSPSKDLAEINNRVNSRHLGRLDFSDVGLVSDSLIAGNVYTANANSTLKHASPDSLHPGQSQQLSRSSSSLDGPVAKRLCMDR